MSMCTNKDARGIFSEYEFKSGTDLIPINFIQWFNTQLLYLRFIYLVKFITEIGLTTKFT